MMLHFLLWQIFTISYRNTSYIYVTGMVGPLLQSSQFFYSKFKFVYWQQ